jgi:hypothetical protein
MKALVRLLAASFALTLVVVALLVLSVAGWIPTNVAVGIGAVLLLFGSLYILPQFARGLTNTQDQSTKNKLPVGEGKPWQTKNPPDEKE